MKPTRPIRIRKRTMLVAVLALAVFGCFTLGVFSYSRWLDSKIRTTVHRQVLDDNIQTAKQLTRLVGEMNLGDLQDFGSWNRLQQVVEEIQLPNQGFVCVVDSSSGLLLCHPELRNRPELRQVAVGQCKINIAGTDVPIVKKVTHSEDGVIGGVASIGGDVQVIAAAKLPGFNANVLVHQRESGISQAIDRVMVPVQSVGYAIASAMGVLVLVVSTAIVRRYDNHLASLNERLEEAVEQRTKSLLNTRNAVIFGLAKLAESRDTDTGQHLERIRSYVSLLAKHLRRRDRSFGEEEIENLALASSLHDIGKVGIPDSILRKPGSLTSEERSIMQLHADLGGACLKSIQKQLGEDDFLTVAWEIAQNHHEKWNGTGYPAGVSGSDIPLSARIVALADVYDALSSQRPYKDAMPHTKVREIILDGRGVHFDPNVVDAFLRCEASFQKIALEASQPIPRVPSLAPLPAVTGTLQAQ